MSGYGGPDDESLHALILSENAVAEARSRLPDPTKEYRECIDCDEEIPEPRRRAMPGCMRCVGCQEIVDRIPRGKVKMVTYLL